MQPRSKGKGKLLSCNRSLMGCVFQLHQRSELEHQAAAKQVFQLWSGKGCKRKIQWKRLHPFHWQLIFRLI